MSRKTWVTIGSILYVLVMAALVAWVTQLVWNAVLIDLFNAPRITFLQSAGLIWLLAVLWWPLQIMKRSKE